VTRNKKEERSKTERDKRMMGNVEMGECGDVGMRSKG